MNDHMKLQIKTMLVSIETFRNGMKIGAMKDDGIIDRNEAKIIRKAEKASEEYAARLKKLIAAFGSAVENGPLTSFEVMSDNGEQDSFRRYSDSGAEILCVFNHSDAPQEIGRRDLQDAETGAPGGIVPPHDCRLFWKKSS